MDLQIVPRAWQTHLQGTPSCTQWVVPSTPNGARATNFGLEPPVQWQLYTKTWGS